jgi:hypothetical protein
MKKLSLILAGVVLFGGISFARPVVKQDNKAKTEKKVGKDEKKTAVKEKKVATKEKKVAKDEKKAAK